VVKAEPYGRIISLSEWADLREGLGTIVCTSGGFDPLHPGHATCIVESSRLGDALVVVVNGDSFLRAKKGRPFQDLRTRCQIVSCVRGVDFVIPFEIDDDPTVCEALRRIRPHVFTKGGDRTDIANIPEWGVCQEHGIRIETGVGLAKDWSSSDFLREWGEFWAERRAGTHGA
jgi:cytidyltransferase-like protein